jgi:predicted nucleotidyltransferase
MPTKLPERAILEWWSYESPARSATACTLRAAIQAVRNRLTAECSVERLMLFGSVVRGEADAESDADLLIVLTERPTAQVRDRITSLILDINLAYDTNLSELIVDR